MSDMQIAYAPHRFTVDDFHRMSDAGYFAPDARVELLDGQFYETVVSMNPPHAVSVQRLNVALVRRLGDVATIRCQLPVILGEYSEPLPDFALVRPNSREYLDGHPQTDDVFFLVEVSDSSHDQDRRLKAPLYAHHGVREVWLVDLVDDLVVAYRDPRADGFAIVTVARRGETIAPLAFPGIRVPVDEMLPPR
ncbi:MAG TPA: Uma2 family endonuclease [Candidatus Sulfotelmatobacter sp.]|nr:Uma2 family endonuclease [Candidatus Sulfotelmatobacter sp.]